LQEERKRERILKMWSVSRYGNLSGITRFFSSADDPQNTNEVKK